MTSTKGSSPEQVIHCWVDPTCPREETGVGSIVLPLMRALADRGARIIPVRASLDGLALVPLSEKEIRRLVGEGGWEPPGPREVSAGWLLIPGAVVGPHRPFLKTPIRMAKAHGLRVAAILPEGIVPGATEDPLGHRGAYGLALAAADVVFAFSEAAITDLRAYWHQEGVIHEGGTVTCVLRQGRAEAQTPSAFWSGCAGDLLAALADAAREIGDRARAGAAPVIFTKPLLSICVTTYNRAAWLSHSLPLILEQTRHYQDLIEVVVCDNASEDHTAQVVRRFEHDSNLRYHCNEKNVGMLGNLSVSCNMGRGRYIWVIGDDDLMVEGAIERVLAAVACHPETELIYTNYAYTLFDHPDDLKDVGEVIRGAPAVSSNIRDVFSDRVSVIAAQSLNCFTAIYCLIYREDHARRAYNQDTSGRPFSTLLTTVPTADYVCRHMFDRPGYWIGDPCVVVNHNVSWMRYASLFILERFPELYDLMQEHGAVPGEVDALRTQHIPGIERWFRDIHFGPQRENLAFFSVERLVLRFAHLPAFQRGWPNLIAIYQEAFRQGQAGAGAPTPERLEEVFRERAAKSREEMSHGC